MNSRISLLFTINSRISLYEIKFLDLIIYNYNIFLLELDR